MNEMTTTILSIVVQTRRYGPWIQTFVFNFVSYIHMFKSLYLNYQAFIIKKKDVNYPNFDRMSINSGSGLHDAKVPPKFNAPNDLVVQCKPRHGERPS